MVTISHSASMLSSMGLAVGAPRSSWMQACTTGSRTTLFLYSSAMRRMVPMVRCFTRRSWLSRSNPLSFVSAARASVVLSNWSWHVFSSSFWNDMGLDCPFGGASSGSCSARAWPSWAYMATKVGCSTAFSNTRLIRPFSTSTLLTCSISCPSRRSNFSGVSLLRIPFTAFRAAASPSLDVVPGIHAFLPTSAADCSWEVAPPLPAAPPAGPLVAFASPKGADAGRGCCWLPLLPPLPPPPPPCPC
mmetsp:Transcript_3648/g.10575  ORF Transcript_3648/g.10575 Transcript_3648/m.10575 type:complete len:246 (+) Transcript_3648:4312-5049(+)